jgi:two-component system OmpR family sensor kinase
VSAPRSIRRELVVWLSAGFLAAIAVAAVATYLRAREEANEIFDYQLKQMSASLTGVPLAGSPPGSASGADALIVQVWDRSGVQVYLSRPQQPLPHDAQPGFNTVRTSTGEWRVFSALAGNQVVQVAQPMSGGAAASMALRTTVPLLAVVPFWRSVWYGTRAACVR